MNAAPLFSSVNIGIKYMQVEDNIDSDDYWNRRFGDDWELF
jgi:hypothetical protein